MRKSILIISLLFLVCESRSQIFYPDSLLNVMRSSKSIDTRLSTARAYAWYYGYKANLDSMYMAANKLIKMGKSKIIWT
jgi:hypothetical protein